MYEVGKHCTCYEHEIKVLTDSKVRTFIFFETLCTVIVFMFIRLWYYLTM